MRFHGNPPWLSQSFTGAHGLPFRSDRQIRTSEDSDRVTHGSDASEPSVSTPDLQPISELPVADHHFDRWLVRKLHDAHDSVLREPMPAELERLVQLFATAATADAAQPCSSTALDDAQPFPTMPSDEGMAKPWSLD